MGLPFQGGNTSVNFTDWKISDNIVQNQATSNRIWLVPLPYQNQPSGTTVTVQGTIADGSNGGTNTTAQAFANTSSGTRFFSGNVVNASSVSLVFQNIATFTDGSNLTVFVHYVIGGSGGRVSTTGLVF